MCTPIYLNPELSNSCFISSMGLRCEVSSQILMFCKCLFLYQSEINTCLMKRNRTISPENLMFCIDFKPVAT